jgi:transcriptional regulator with XRE-family HTH domain
VGVYEKIRFIRQFKGWSQEEMASKLGISTHAYAKIERGETDINLSRLEQIAQVVAVELPQLLGLSEKNIFNFFGVIESCHNPNSQFNTCPIDTERQHELEKRQSTIEKLELEISYLKQENQHLKEMIELMKKPSEA